MANAIDFKVQPTRLWFRAQRRAEYPIDFKLQQGGKRGYPARGYCSAYLLTMKLSPTHRRLTVRSYTAISVWPLLLRYPP